MNSAATLSRNEIGPAGREIPTHPDAALLPIEVAFLTGKSESTLEAERRHCLGIPYLKGAKLVRYRRRDVDAWIAANLRGAGADDPFPFSGAETTGGAHGVRPPAPAAASRGRR